MPVDLEKYRNSDLEKARTEDILRLVPPHLNTTALDIGARDCFFSLLLARRFSHVVALDLKPPPVSNGRITPMVGDVTGLPFEDRSFDFVLCAEVLEHVPALENACRELSRICGAALLVGVPYQQDLRYGQMTCRSCGRNTPPWGHVNRFSEERLKQLFPDLVMREVSFLGSTHDRTTALAANLMSYAGNPWGPYDQEEPCVHCGQPLQPPGQRTAPQRISGRLAHYLNRAQRSLTKPHPFWIHALFTREQH